jgi:ribosomal protein S18 acetylase RimI-like enzyme
MNVPVTIRFATADDVGALLGFVRDLAAYEKMPDDAVMATEENLRRYGFGEERRFEALLALIGDKPAGAALFFTNFSTWQARPGLYLEDIFVSEWARCRGIGRQLMARLARIAIKRGCGRLDFSVRHDSPARAFYDRIGTLHLADWARYRAEGEALVDLAADDTGDGTP